MFVTTAMMGASFRNDPSLSSDSTTSSELLPTRAFDPCIAATRPPTTTVGSRLAVLRMDGHHRRGGGFAVASRDGDSELRRINSASSSPRGITGICNRRASSDFRIASIERGSDDDGFRAGYVLAHRARNRWWRLIRRKTIGNRAEFDVGTGDFDIRE